MSKLRSSKHSIKVVYSIAILLFILVPVIITNSFYFNYFSITYKESHKKAITLNSTSLNHSLDQYLSKYSQVFDIIESNPSWDSITEINDTFTIAEVKDYYQNIADGINVDSYLEHAQNYKNLVQLIDTYESNESIRAIYIGTPKKYVFTNDISKGFTVLKGYNDNGDITTFDCTSRLWYTGAVELAGEIYWSTPYLDKDGTSIVLSASKAVFDDENNLIAVISMDISSDDFSEEIVEFKFDNNYTSFILDEEGTYIFGDIEKIGTPIGDEKLVDFLSSNDQYFEENGSVYTKIYNEQSEWYIIHSYTENFIQDDISTLAKSLLVFIIIILIFTVVAVLITINYYINPIIALTKHFKAIEDGKDITMVLPVNNKVVDNEIGSLYNSVRSMQKSVALSMEKIEYMSYYDMLTDVNNRNFFEEQIKELDNDENLPLSIAMLDVNGLKLINDAFGHHAGDELLKLTGKLLIENTRSKDIKSRWGGDEFVVIFPGTSHDLAKKIMDRMIESAKNRKTTYGEVSLALGIATKTKASENIDKKFKLAEELMYQNKNNIISSVRSETINTIVNTLFEKSPETEQHSQRVSKIASLIALKMGLPENKINDIETIGTIHDIGKIVIDSSLLNKATSLTDEEMNIIKTHPVVGSKILSSTNKYTRLIPGVLHHHERIDGNGYPDNLKGDDIPFESKIICIADAFDAMTQQRPYKKRPMTIDEACEELIRCSGTQFDKDILDVFLKEVVPMLKE